jgi:hypothetical protein
MIKCRFICSRVGIADGATVGVVVVPVGADVGALVGEDVGLTERYFSKSFAESATCHMAVECLPFACICVHLLAPTSTTAQSFLQSSRRSSHSISGCIGSHCVLFEILMHLIDPWFLCGLWGARDGDFTAVGTGVGTQCLYCNKLAKEEI